MLKFEHMFQPIAIGVVTVSNPEKTALILVVEVVGCKAVGEKGMLLEQGVAKRRVVCRSRILYCGVFEI